MATHIAERLGLPPVDYHPDEFYNMPISVSERLSTGDLTVVNEAVYVIVTPRCNLARDAYPNHLMLALCRPLVAPWGSIKERFATGEAKKVDSAMRELRNYVTQNHAIGVHFLPPCGDKGPWVVDFKEIMTMTSDHVPALTGARFASIATSFVPNLVQRYAAYLGRIGQPDLDCETIRSRLLQVLAAPVVIGAPAATA